MDELLRANNKITEIVEKYSDMVLRLALSQTKNRHDADDVYQDVFFRMIKKVDIFESDDHIKAWLIKVTINCCRTRFSSYWNRNKSQLDENMVFEDRSEKDVYFSVLELPKKYRAVIHLYYYEEMSIENISQILNQSLSATKMQLQRGRKMLREKLGEEYLYV